MSQWVLGPSRGQHLPQPVFRCWLHHLRAPCFSLLPHRCLFQQKQPMSRKLKPKAGCKQTAKYAADNVCLYDWRQHQERAEIGDDLRPPRQIIPGATFMTDLNMNLHRLSHKRSFAPLEFPRNRIPRMAHPEWHTHTHTHRFHKKMEPLVTSESTRYVTHGALKSPETRHKNKKRRS